MGSRIDGIRCKLDCLLARLAIFFRILPLRQIDDGDGISHGFAEFAINCRCGSGYPETFLGHRNLSPPLRTITLLPLFSMYAPTVFMRAILAARTDLIIYAVEAAARTEGHWCPI